MFSIPPPIPADRTNQLTVSAYLLQLSERGVEVWLDGDSLRYRAKDSLAKSDLIDQLKACKPEIVDYLKRLRVPPSRRPLRSYERPPQIPLSVSQSLWFRPVDPAGTSAELEQLPVSFKITGPVNCAAIESAVAALVARHEILRTIYRWDGQSASQHILEPDDYRFCYSDLTERGPEAEAAARDIVAEHYHRPIDFDGGRPLQTWFFKVGDDEYVLVLLLWHIAFDNGSMRLLVRDFFTIYDALANDDTPDLPAMTLQYADYALWELSWHDRVNRDAALEHWRGKLKCVKPLCFENGGVARDDIGIASCEFREGLRFRNAVHQFGTEYGYTIAELYAATVNVLLSCWRSEERVLTTYISDTRPPGAENLLGCFVRASPLLVDLRGEVTFTDALARLRLSFRDVNDPGLAADRTVIPNLGRVIINIARSGAASVFDDGVPHSNRIPSKPAAGPQRRRARISAAQSQHIRNLARARSLQIVQSDEEKSRDRTGPVEPVDVQTSSNIGVRRWTPPTPWTQRNSPDLQIYLADRNGLRGRVIYAADRVEQTFADAFTKSIPALMQLAALGPDETIGRLFRSTPLGALTSR